MNKTLLCLNHMGGTEIEYVKRAFDGNWIVPMGPDVAAFERELQKFLFKSPATEPRIVALSAGSAAVHLALKALGVGKGDEVIVQSFTFCASANPVMYLGATPVFVDSEADTWNMDPRLLDLAIRSRIAATGRKPRAIVVVHLYGMPAKMHQIMEVAQKYGIPVVEDAAEALGSQYDGHECGTLGTYGVLSFNGNKMITTSGGGALVCPDADAYRRIMFFATQAREGYPYYQHEEIGYNYRLSNICAAIGRGQLEIITDHIAHHRMIADVYAREFADVPGIRFHSNPSPKFNANFWLSTITIDPDVRVEGQEQAYSATVSGAVGGAAGMVRAAATAQTDCQPNANVEAMRLILSAEGIESRPLWKPMHKQPVYRVMPAYINGTSEALFHIGLCLPSGPYVAAADAARIASIIKKAANL